MIGKFLSTALLAAVGSAMSVDGVYDEDRLYSGKPENGRDYNFCPGPCVLPEAVLEEAQRDMMNWRNTGSSVNELNHRDAPYVKISSEARDDLRELLSVPDNFKIFFFQGGATMQYAAVALNLLDGAQTANYLTTGFWGNQCFDEAKKYCVPNEVDFTARESGWTTLKDPSEWNIDASAPYFVYVDNETANGFEFNDFPFEVIPEGMLLISDMSSNISTKPIDWTKYAAVYAGA
jgi:phosphoserine aminotransferase